MKTQVKVCHAYKGFGLFIDRKVPQERLINKHFADAMMEIVKAAGSIPDEKGIEVFWNQEAELKWAHRFTNSDTIKIALNPGADDPKKRWPIERYARWSMN